MKSLEQAFGPQLSAFSPRLFPKNLGKSPEFPGRKLRPPGTSRGITGEKTGVFGPEMPQRKLKEIILKGITGYQGNDRYLSDGRRMVSVF